MQPEHEHFLTEQRQRYLFDPIPLAAVQGIQDGLVSSKTFETTNISGNAIVIQGDVYLPCGIFKVEYGHPQAQWHTHKLCSPVRDVETLSTITRTTSRPRNGSQILPHINLTWRTISKTNHKYVEKSWFISINFLQLVMLTFGLVYRPSGLFFRWPKMRNLVPEDAPFIVACKRGDVITMRRLVSQGEAAYSNVTKDNLTPIYFALESGNVTAVQEVLNHTTDIEATFGNNHTSALAWALHHRNEDAVRLVLARYADLGYISLKGWAPVFYLWGNQTVSQKSSSGLLQMLQTSDPREFQRSISGVIDIGDMSLLQRVASLGTPEELSWLLGCGADVHLKAGRLEWTAMFDAAYDGKVGNLGVLEYAAPGAAIRERDLRGWSLLHVAAAEGQTHVVSWLLEKGADPFAKSRASFVDVPEALLGLECTPAEVARAQGLQREQEYWSAVREICGAQFLPKESQ